MEGISELLKRCDVYGKKGGEFQLISDFFFFFLSACSTHIHEHYVELVRGFLGKDNASVMCLVVW